MTQIEDIARRVERLEASALKATDAEIAAVRGPNTDPVTDRVFGRAEDILYDVILRSPNGSGGTLVEDVRPSGGWQPEVRVWGVEPGTQIGVGYRGNTVRFFFHEPLYVAICETAP